MMVIATGNNKFIRLLKLIWYICFNINSIFQLNDNILLHIRSKIRILFLLVLDLFFGNTGCNISHFIVILICFGIIILSLSSIKFQSKETANNKLYLKCVWNVARFLRECLFIYHILQIFIFIFSVFYLWMFRFHAEINQRNLISFHKKYV